MSLQVYSSSSVKFYKVVNIQKITVYESLVYSSRKSRTQDFPLVFILGSWRVRSLVATKVSSDIVVSVICCLQIRLLCDLDLHVPEAFARLSYHGLVETDTVFR